MSEIIIQNPKVKNSIKSIDALEVKRLELIKISKYVILIKIISTIAIFIFVFHDGIDINDIYLGFPYFIFVSAIYRIADKWFENNNAIFCKEFKNSIINNLVLNYSNELSYDSQKFIESDHFDRSQIFPEYYNNYTGEDLISFNTFGDLKLSELIVFKGNVELNVESAKQFASGVKNIMDYYQNPNSTKSKEFMSSARGVSQRTDSNNYTVFKGFFGYATFPFEFEGVTVLRPTNKIINKLNSQFVLPNMIYLESPRFMEQWTIESTSQIGARLALNTDIMDNLLELNEKLEDKLISLSFVGNQVFFAIHQNKFLDPDYKRPAGDQKFVKDFVLELEIIQNIIETFKLNQSVNRNTLSNQQKLNLLKSKHNSLLLESVKNSTSPLIVQNILPTILVALMLLSVLYIIIFTLSKFMMGTYL